MEAEDMPDWLKKCITCKHAYKKKDEDDCIYCRRRLGECKYETYKEKSDGKKNITKLYKLCLLLQDLCEEHTNCTFCPFSDEDGCLIEGETNIHADELYTLFCLKDLEEGVD